MCDIEFRGFHKDENGTETIYINDCPIKGRWVYGYYVNDSVCKRNMEDCKHYIIQLAYEDCDKRGYYYLNSLYYSEVIPETVGQYTGLEDKNGKKIFENDLIKIKKYHYYKDKEYLIGNVVFRDGMFEIKCDDVLFSTMFTFRVWSESIEIIGTIFDKEVK